jgi:hypothetical protein
VTKRFLFPILLILLLVPACSAPPSTPVEQAAPTTLASQPEPVAPTSEPTQETIATSIAEATPVVENDPPDCLGGEISPIGESIAEDYEFTDYAEVISWFCNGAEFEDILVALESESLTGTPAEDMLQMLADDFTWDEIWQLIGLTE